MAEYSQIRAEIHNWSLESDDRVHFKLLIYLIFRVIAV